MRRFTKNTGLVVISLLFCLIVGEGILRVVPNRYEQEYAQLHSNKSSVEYRDLGDGLFTLAPGTNARRQRSCYDIAPIGINAQGFRDRPRKPDADGFRALLLGDSFIEALQVADTQHVASRMEEILGFPVMNGAISGYSTATELAAYRKLLRPLRPDLVVLFFFAGNDVKGNSCALDPERTVCGRIDQGKPAVGPEAEGKRGAVAPAPEPGPLRLLKGYLGHRLVLFQVLHDAKYAGLGLVNRITGHVPPRWQVYLRTMAQAWQDAWTLSETYLATLRDEIEADGARLVLVIIPDHFAANPEWRSELMFGAGSGVPDDFDPHHPARRLTAIAESLELPVLDLLPALASYRERFGLPYPRFSYRCDGHWNPLAHDLVAHEVGLFLTRQGLLPPGGPSVVELAKKRDAAFATSPRGFLGADGYRQIYEGGVYRGPRGSNP